MLGLSVLGSVVWRSIEHFLRQWDALEGEHSQIMLEPCRKRGPRGHSARKAGADLCLGASSFIKHQADNWKSTLASRGGRRETPATKLRLQNK